MAVVIFGAKGIGLSELVDELQWISDEAQQEVKYILAEVSHDWQNKVTGYTDSPVQDLELEIRARPVKKMVLVLNHNPRKFNDWLDFVKLISERMQSDMQNFIASHLIIALNVEKKDFKMKRKQIANALQKNSSQSRTESRNNIILFESGKIHEFASDILYRASKQEIPITTEECTQFRLLNNCHLFNSNEIILTATSLPDLEKQVQHALREINFEIYELQFFTQDKRIQPKVPLTDSVFEAISLKKYNSSKKAKVDLSIVVKCPRCEREVTNEQSHEHCELLQTAIEEKDPLLVFLQSLRLQDLFPLLKQEDITLELLFEFESEEKLESIGIKKIAHRLKLIDALGERKVLKNSVEKRDIEACQALKQDLDDTDQGMKN